MNRTGLILLQAVGALSILPYPFVLLANIMSIAATGSTPATRLPWILLSFYPLVWIVLYFLAWRAMRRGSVTLAFGLSSIPALACLLVFGVFMFSWVGFGLGTAGIGPGGLHSTTNPTYNPISASILLAGQDIQLPPGPEAAVEKALHDIDANPSFINYSVYPQGSPINVALGTLTITLDGTITGDPEGNRDRIRILRALVAHGAKLSGNDATAIFVTWKLRRALYDGPVTTASENPLVWRIVTHNRGESKPWDPLKEKFPERRDGPEPFVIRESEMALLNQPTRVHGTPLYAALLDSQSDACAVIIKSGGHLSAEEEKDPAAAAALQSLFESDASLRAAYKAP